MPNTSPAYTLVPFQPSARRTFKIVLGLTVMVLLAHWALLQGVPQFSIRDGDVSAPVSRPFTTRTITVATQQPTAVAALPAKTAKKAQSIAEPIAESSSAAASADEIEPVSKRSEPIPQESDTAEMSPAPEAPEPSPQPTEGMGAQSYVFSGSVRLKYDIKGEVKGFPYFANGELLWLHDGNTYDARAEISHFLLGSRVQTSKGNITPQGLEPIRFGDKVRSEVAAHFERSKGKVSFSANTPDAPLLPGAQDHLSVFIQLGAMLAGDPDRFVEGVQIPVQAIGPRNSEDWVVHVGAKEFLTLPGGPVKAVKLWRDATGEHDTKVEMWLSAEMDYLPVRIRLSQTNGDFVEQQWRATQKP